MAHAQSGWKMYDGKKAAQRTWGASPTGWTSARAYQPGTREFFETAIKFRDEIEQPWLSEVVPFASTNGKKVLEVGFGPGYDALKFLQAGADYTGIDITPENIDRTRKHLGYFGYVPNVEQGDAENLPFADASFDIAYSNGVLHHVPDMPRAMREIARTLRPGGEFYLLLYNRRSVFYTLSVVLPHFLTGGFMRESLKRRMGRIEFSTADADPIVNVYGRSELCGILKDAGFSRVLSIKTRKCIPEDLPGASKLEALYRRIPLSAYRSIGNIAGWYLIAHAQKA